LCRHAERPHVAPALVQDHRDDLSAAIASTVETKQTNDLPLNGRNYLDLLQLVPGVAVSRQNGS